MRQFFSVLVALVIAFSTVAIATSAPIAPGDPVHMWLFDANSGANNNSIADEGTSANVPLFNNALNTTYPGYPADNGSTRPAISLYGVGSNVPSNGGNTLLNTLPFNYAGNNVVVNDFKVPNPPSYPQRYHMRGLTTEVDGATDVIGNAGTVAFWFNPMRHDGAGNGYLFSFGDNLSGSTNRLYAIAEKPNVNGDYTGNVIFNYRIAGVDSGIVGDADLTYGAATDGAFVDGNWKHLAFTWSTTAGLSMYVDGALEASNPGLTAFNGFDADTFGFSHVNLGSPSSGLYDEFAIFDSALSADNIEWLSQHSLTELSSAAVPEPGSAVLLLIGLAALYPLARWGKKLGIVK